MHIIVQHLPFFNLAFDENSLDSLGSIDRLPAMYARYPLAPNKWSVKPGRNYAHNKNYMINITMYARTTVTPLPLINRSDHVQFTVRLPLPYRTVATNFRPNERAWYGTGRYAVYATAIAYTA